ncbi:MAG: flavodoxin family protein [Bacteroidales bacterium]|jgi:flavodoxin
MNRALILYHSRRGTTAAYSEEIAAELAAKGVEATVLPMYQLAKAPVQEADTIFIGCWTSGLLFFLQKPEKMWVDYAKQLPSLKNKQVVLFTTYKILTGSMFREMIKHLPDDASVSLIKLKSRSSKITNSNRELLRLLTTDYQLQKEHLSSRRKPGPRYDELTLPMVPAKAAAFHTAPCSL